MRNFKVLSTRLGSGSQRPDGSRSGEWKAGDTVYEADLPAQDIDRLIETKSIEEIVYNTPPEPVTEPVVEPTPDKPKAK